MNGTTQTPTAYIAKCPRCKAPVTASWNRDEAAEAGYQIRTDCCGRWAIALKVDAKIGIRECGDFCTTGTGRSCTCSCGGASHGAAWRIK